MLAILTLAIEMLITHLYFHTPNLFSFTFFKNGT